MRVIPAVTHLREHQQQADADGIMVTVSRQALDEVLATFDQAPVSPAEQVGWRPIETAPVMEAVLVAGGDCDYPCAGNWSGMSDEPWCVDGQSDVHGEIGWPTHWMPLPTPPAEGSGR